MDKASVISAALAGLVGAIGGFFSRRTSKESNNTNQLVEAVGAWAKYGQEMREHWESCEEKYDLLEQELAATKQEMAVQAAALGKALDEIEGLKAILKEIKSA